MNKTVLFSLLGYAGLFLFATEILSSGLKQLCGSKIKNLLAFCTKNRLSAVLTGFAVTAVLQSSCAVTVMAVSFIDSGLLSLNRAVGIIMGSNIGTTVTSLLLTLNISSYASILIFICVIAPMIFKNEKIQKICYVLLGFGLLFVSMKGMEDAMVGLKDNPNIQALFLKNTNKLGCLFSGFLVTAILQSSSATVGMLQSACQSGIVSTSNLVFILFGQNIGAVLPTLLSSLKQGKEAKEGAIVHLLFNLIGTFLFVLIALFTPYISFLDKIPNGYFRVSLAHIIFNTVSTAILLPLGNQLAKAAEKAVNF